MILFHLIDVYSAVLIGSVVISWLGLPPDNPAVKIVRSLTEPVLAPVRKALPVGRLAANDFQIRPPDPEGEAESAGGLLLAFPAVAGVERDGRPGDAVTDGAALAAAFESFAHSSHLPSLP